MMARLITMTPCAIVDSLPTRTLYDHTVGSRSGMGGSQRTLRLRSISAWFVRIAHITLLKPNDLLRDSHGNKQVERYTLTGSKIDCAYTHALGHPKRKDIRHGDHRLFPIADR